MTGFMIPVISWIVWECAVNNRYDLNRPEPELNSCTRSEALPSNRKEATQIDRLPTENGLMIRPASTSVRLAVRKRPNVIVVEPKKTSDKPVIWNGMELLEIPQQTAEEASTGSAADNQPLSINQIYTRTTITNLLNDYVSIGRPAPLWGPVKLAKEASTDDTTNEQCIYEIMDNNKTTDRKLSMEFLEIPQQLLTRGFLELAEEARNIFVKNKQCFLVEEVLPQVTEMTRLMEEDLGQSVEVHREGAARVPTDKFEAGQLMQWPDIKSDGVMIDGIMLESEMSPVGTVRDVAELVSVAAKSEVFTPVVCTGGGGGVVAVAAPWPL